MPGGLPFRWRVVRALGVPVAIGYAALGFAAICPIPEIPITPAPDNQPPSLKADWLTLKNGLIRAHEDVRLTRNGQALEAPFMEYHRKTGKANAHGGLIYYKPGVFMTADEGAVDVDNSTGILNDVKYVLTTGSGARGHAGTVISKKKNHYQLDGATYTTCLLDSPTWYLSATDVNLNRETGRGAAWNAVLHLYGLPIFYTPYFNFPIDNRRHTGFLAPSIGQSSSSGFTLTLPFYINLAPNYDLTLYPRYYGKRGFQLGAQGRYRFRHQKGRIAGQYMPFDQVYGDSRSFFHFQHNGKFNKYVGFEAVYNRASDDAYFDDLSDGPGGTSSSVLERGAQLTFATTGARLDVLVQNFQTLNANDNGFYSVFNHNPYTRLPRVQLKLLSPTAPFRIGMNTSFTNFVSDNPNAIEGMRYNAKPRLIWSVDHGGWFARSEAAYQFTHYDMDNPNSATNHHWSSSVNRTTPSFELSSGLRLTRRTANGWMQTLSPRIQYLYSGYENQKDIPIFDSGMPDLHYMRLFSDNRFTGIDRIGDANQITLGATTRLYSPQSGRALAKLSLGRVTSFRDLRVSLPRTGITGYSNSGSDYVGSLMLTPIPQIHTRGAVAYSANSGRIDRALASFLYSTDAGYGISLGYRYYRGYRPETNKPHPDSFDTLKQVALGAYVPIGDQLKLVGRWNYSLEIDRNIETLVGVQYSPTCCIAARLSWRRYVNNRRDNHDHVIMFQLAFRGLAELGKTVDSFVRDDIYSGVAPGQTENMYNTLQLR